MLHGAELRELWIGHWNRMISIYSARGGGGGTARFPVRLLPFPSSTPPWKREKWARSPHLREVESSYRGLCKTAPTPLQSSRRAGDEAGTQTRPTAAAASDSEGADDEAWAPPPSREKRGLIDWWLDWRRRRTPLRTAGCSGTSPGISCSGTCYLLFAKPSSVAPRAPSPWPAAPGAASLFPRGSAANHRRSGRELAKPLLSGRPQEKTPSLTDNRLIFFLKKKKAASNHQKRGSWGLEWIPIDEWNVPVPQQKARN